MINILKKMYKQKRPGLFYYDIDHPEVFFYGYISEIDDSWCLLSLISTMGRPDGFALLLSSRIYRVEIDGLYVRKMRILCNNNYKSDQNQIDLSTTIKSLFQGCLEHLMLNKTVVSFELNNSGSKQLFGYILSVRNPLTIKLIDEYGYFDGRAFVSEDSISLVYFQGEDELTRQLLTH